MSSRISAALAGVVLAGSVAALAVPDALSQNTITGTVETIVDGDSLRVCSVNGSTSQTGERHGSTPCSPTNIRLFGVDAVELHQLCEPGAWRCGHAAWQALYGMVQRDRYVRCEERNRDRYGRIVAVCRNGVGDLGRLMVARGYAFAARKYSTVYVDEEVAAKAGRLGIWRDGVPVNPADWRRGVR